VSAGPGTGKTWTLLRRAVRLVDGEQLAPSDLLMLSFTRSVVHELGRRDRRDHIRRSAFPETFDSFASRLLRENAPDDRWTRYGFDRRIVAAIELLASGAAAPTLEPIVHVFVDEVQDLVGARAMFVASLLQACGCGFTTFGDPAQAIYDHEIGAGGGPSLIVRLNDLADRRQELEGNRRSDDGLARTLREVRGALMCGEDISAVPASDAFARMDTLGPWEDLSAMVPLLPGDRAILCRDNATALLMSRALHENGVVHRVRRGAADRAVAGWVAPVLAGASTSTRDRVDERLAELEAVGFPGLPQPDDAWALLCRLDPGGRGMTVRTHEAAGRIGAGADLPPELIDEPDHSLVVSSIHRAKGLEFDRCVVVEWPHRKDENVEQARLEERVLFVAMSRAREVVVHGGARQGGDRWIRSRDAKGRLIKPGGQAWQTFGMEIQGDDVHAVEPAGAVVVDEDAMEIQRRLEERVRPGDAVVLLLRGTFEYRRRPLPVYALMHDAGLVGITGEQFGDAIRARAPRRVPARIVNVRVDDLETVKGSVETGEAAGLGRSGLWLRPRLVGLGDFDWEAV